MHSIGRPILALVDRPTGQQTRRLALGQEIRGLVPGQGTPRPLLLLRPAGQETRGVVGGVVGEPTLRETLHGDLVRASCFLCFVDQHEYCEYMHV